MRIRWARVFGILFFLAVIVNVAFVVSNHEEAKEFFEDALDSEVGAAFVSLGFLLLLFMFVVWLLAYVVRLFRRS